MIQVVHSTDNYLSMFRTRLCNEPEWLFSNVARCMGDSVSKTKNTLNTISQDIQVTINRHIYKKAKAYNSQLVQVLLGGEDDYVFPNSKLLPIHTLEWLTASTEFLVEYCMELSWIAKDGFSKIIKVSKEKYGKQFTDNLINSIEDAIERKNCDWNRVLFTLIRDISEFTPEYNERDIRRAEHYLIRMISNVSEHVWGPRDRIDIVEKVEQAKAYSKSKRTSLIMLWIISSINVKAKKRE